MVAHLRAAADCRITLFRAQSPLRIGGGIARRHSHRSNSRWRWRLTRVSFATIKPHIDITFAAIRSSDFASDITDVRCHLCHGSIKSVATSRSSSKLIALPIDAMFFASLQLNSNREQNPSHHHISWGRARGRRQTRPYKDAKLVPSAARSNGIGARQELRTSPVLQIADVCRNCWSARKWLCSARNGRVPSVPRETNLDFLKNGKSLCTYCRRRCRGALQQARANRGGWRLVPYDVLMRPAAIL